jgi:hypothetical protein
LCISIFWEDTFFQDVLGKNFVRKSVNCNCGRNLVAQNPSLLHGSEEARRENVLPKRVRAERTGTDVMILKIFSPKKLAFLTENKAKLC